MTWPHTSVLLPETLAALAPKDGERFVDCTAGAGGHAEALLSAADCAVLLIDRDPSALAIARERLARFGDRAKFFQGSFGDLKMILDEAGWSAVDGVLADLGVSSIQLDTPNRGFSFRLDGAVDMRMDPSAELSASDLVETWTEEDLTHVIATYGEERHARRIARAIVQKRPFKNTLELAAAIAAVVPTHGPPRIHPATRTFQALRIQVNDELGQLNKLLPAAVEALRPGGRLAILSFHSLEDRIVKQFLALESGRTAPRNAYGHPVTAPRLSAPPSQIPSADDPNPRARSARLRTGVRLP